MKRQLVPLIGLVTSVLLASLSGEALAAAKKPQAKHEAKHEAKQDAKHSASKASHKQTHAGKSDKHHKTAHKGSKKSRVAAHGKAKPAPKDTSRPSDAPPLTGDLALIRDAVDLVRRGKTADATAIEAKLADPTAQKLVEWLILRHPDADVSYSRYIAFIASEPGWPGTNAMRRRAEARLWQEKADPTTTRNFIGDTPLTAKGRFALARALLAGGDSEGAAVQVRTAWASEELTERTESDVLDAFRSLLRSEDHRARMDKRIGAKDMSGASRVAHRLGSDEVAIVKACIAANGGEKKAESLLGDVPASSRQDLGYSLCRTNWLMRQNKLTDAARATIEAPQATMAAQDTDEWWRTRRLLARKLLDINQFQAAYDVVRTAALPANDSYRAEFHFMTGWIALRYLDDATTARAHFAHIDEGSSDPIVLARANYWRGRAAEALGDGAAMRTAYEAAARNTTAYYGQLARAKLGVDSLTLRAAPTSEPTHDAMLTDELVHAAGMLYDIGERDTVVSFFASLGEQSNDAQLLAALGELAGQRNDARAMLQLGKTALARGVAVDAYAFPTIGIPQHSPIAPDIGRSMTYAVARTESAFDPRDRSAANAVGLMQVTPEAGRDTAKRFGVSYDWDRMVNDSVYNTQMGAAELSALLSEYKGCHIMVFAGYNAGRGRVREWIKAHGDPRDPNVDPVDWVERIPLSETRNYVQRVMENMLVYRVRFDSMNAAMSKLAPATSATPAATGPEASAVSR
jgi:soluble lytic murein transglycosylase